MNVRLEPTHETKIALVGTPQEMLTLMGILSFPHKTLRVAFRKHVAKGIEEMLLDPRVGLCPEEPDETEPG